MKKIILFLIFPLIIFGQEYYVYKTKGDVNLDGKIEEEIWQKIPTAIGFKKTGSKIYAERQTYFKAFYDEENIYIGVICEEPEMDKIKAKGVDKDYSLWTEDSVEIFFQPEPERETYYYQFVVNAIGSRWSAKYISPGQGGFSIDYIWNAKAYRDKDFWSIEVIIPFKLIGKKPIENEKWKVNISRNILTEPGEKLTSWPNFKGNSFHAIEEFASFIFKGDLEKVDIEKTEKEINKEYIEKIKNLIEELVGYEKIVNEALKNPKFKNEVKPIAEKIEELKKIKKQDLKIKDIEKIKVALLQKMAEKIKEIKSKVMIEGLFE